ncbi:hypothetical protein [Modestobacter versicolor]|nr:hypothetical protein [Modestobacter versicolor]MBB3675845.1 hypothetical protein [Modestobacter versicolor]
MGSPRTLRQTSIRVSARARGALESVARARGVSRERATRELLDAHVLDQSSRPPQKRLSHISTVLHYPPAPPGRTPDGRVRLPVRLDPEVARRAASMSLFLPGQAPRAFDSYSARPLTDAVLTAIARAHPFVDEGLDGLPPLLTHREAQGLWRLTVAATLTNAEQQVVLGRPRSDPTAVILRTGQIAWHDTWRFTAALHLARGLLADGNSSGGRRLLWEQGADFEKLRRDLELTVDLDHRLLSGLEPSSRDLQGRGGAAVWRAERALALGLLTNWMTTAGSPPLTVDPPGWELPTPADWHGRVIDEAATPSPQELADVGANRVLRLTSGGRHVLWPYTADGQPVRGFDALLAGAGKISAAEFVELVLVQTKDTGRHPRVPAATAWELGFVSSVERDDIIAEAQANNDREVSRVLAGNLRSSRVEDDLRAAAHDHVRFAKIARGAQLPCFIVQPTWTWYVDSVREAMASGASTEQLRWLGHEMRSLQRRALEESMRYAGSQAYWLGQADLHDEV